MSVRNKNKNYKKSFNKIIIYLLISKETFRSYLFVYPIFREGLQMGLMSTFVIMIHEMPHEIGDFAHLIKYGYSLQKILST